jgi:hypothetical protein
MNDKSEFIRGNKDKNVNGWKLIKTESVWDYKPLYCLAYWENGDIIEDTEEFIDNKTIAIDYYNSSKGERK